MKEGAKPQELRRGYKRLDGGEVDGGSRIGSGVGHGFAREFAGRAEGWNGGPRSLGGGIGWLNIIMDSAVLTETSKLGALSVKPSAGALGLVISSHTTTGVRWGAQPTFYKGPSSGPVVVLD